MHNPMPRVTYDEQTYALRSRKTVVPDFTAMSRLEVLVWLNQNTIAKGYCKPTNPLIGFAGTISIYSKENQS